MKQKSFIITGAICTGKTTTCKLIKEKLLNELGEDWAYRNMDRVIDSLLDNPFIIQDLIGLLGISFINTEDITINRRALGNLLFNDHRLNTVFTNYMRKHLEGFIIQERDFNFLNKNGRIFFEFAMLMEYGLHGLFKPDDTILLYCDRETKIKRLMEARGHSEESAAKRIDFFIPDEVKMDISTTMINTTNQTPEEVANFIIMTRNR